MKTALFDCISGASGDMILSALLDAGLSLAELKRGLGKLRLKGYRLRVQRSVRRGISGTKLTVVVRAQKASRNLAQILKLIRASKLPAAVKQNACAIFQRIAQVEAKIHGTPVGKVHFHEIGAVDSIVDIVGACIGFHALKLDQIYFTPPMLGKGWAKTEHGLFPVPSPAAVMLLRGMPCHWGAPSPGEWTTPTGAAILGHFGKCTEEIPSFRARVIGYGIGQADPTTHPNVLRLVLGEILEKGGDGAIWSVQTNIDDMQPSTYGPLMEKLLQSSALDVVLIPIQMKKNRPAILVEVLCEDAHLQTVCDILLEETTTFGIRMHRVFRRTLPREIHTVQTSFGPVRYKVARQNSRILKSMPEFEDCLKISRKTKLPLPEVYRVLAEHTPR